MKKTARLLGLLVAIAAGYYYVRQAATTWNGVDLEVLLSAKSIALTFAALALYLAQIPITAMIWRWILEDMDIRMSSRSSYAVIASTQFAKYLPGNVAQHIGRVAVARSFGGDVPTLTLSLIYENVIALLVAVHITMVFLASRPSPGLEQWLPMGSISLVVVAASAGAVLAFLLLPRLAVYLQRKRGPDAGSGTEVRLSLGRLLIAYGVFVASFLSLGLAFTLLVHAVAPANGFSFLPLCGAFAAAWVVGMLVPGAPAGLGVREGILVVLLSGIVTSTAGVAAIALLRVVTTLGDLLHFVLGTWLLRGTAATPPQARGA